MFKNVFFFLFTHFSVGLLFTILLISLNEIGKLFFRLNTLLAAGLISLALLVSPFGPIEWQPWSVTQQGVDVWAQLTYWSFLVTVLLLLAYNVMHPKLHGTLLALSFLTGLAGISSFALVVKPTFAVGFGQHALAVLNGIASTLLLGSVLAAMITGHWYLVQHKLSLTPLKNSSRVYLFSVLLRMVFVVLSLVLYWNVELRTSPLRLLTSLDFDSILFLLRFGIGLLVPLVFGLMIWSAVKIRSTQSATGMLYATIVLILIGETFARFLYFSVGIPL